VEIAPGGDAPIDRSGRRFGPIWLVPGVTTLNAVSFAFAAYTTIGLLTFIATGTPYVLNANLGIPIEDQGQYTGDFQLLNEIILLLVFAPAGVLADRIGRRGVYAVGLLAMGLSPTCFTRCPRSIFELGPISRDLRGRHRPGYRYARNASLADYPQDISRGKMVAFVGILNGLGVVTVTFTIARLPGILADAGYPPLDAGRYAHWVAAGILFSERGHRVYRGLQKGSPVKQRRAAAAQGNVVLAGFTQGRNPRIALAYACAFIARSDLVVLGTFTTRCGGRPPVSSRGWIPARAAARGAQIFGTASLAALLWLPIIGSIVDRMNRVAGVALCMSIAVVGFLSTLMIDDALDRASLGWFALLGIGQISAFLGATVLISAEAPRAKRAAP
jgi:hypothetical protein